MYTKIIVGYDGSAQADDALALGKLLAGATGASLTAVAVLQFDPQWGGRDIHFQDLDAELTEKLEQAARSAGAGAETIASSSPAHGLHELRGAGSRQTSWFLARPGMARPDRSWPAAWPRASCTVRRARSPSPRRVHRQTHRMASPGHRRIRRLGRGAHRLGRGHRPRPRQRCAGQGGCRRRALTGRSSERAPVQPQGGPTSTTTSTR